MSTKTTTLNTTSFAILGLLDLKPWSTYELAMQMRRNLHHFWPRAESNLYVEAKRLVREGYAESRSEPLGRRPRTVHIITEQGRRALQQWLAIPAAKTRLESELLVKVMWGNLACKPELVATIQAYRAELESRLDVFTAIFGEYLETGGPFPERLHVNVLCYRLLWDLTLAELKWAGWALVRIESWPDTRTAGDPAPHLAELTGMLGCRPVADLTTRPVGS